MSKEDRDTSTGGSGGGGHTHRSASPHPASDGRSEGTPAPSHAPSESPPAGGETTTPSSEPEDRDASVAKLEAERDEYLELAQRARAELENYRKRVAGETAASERRGRAAIAREVLPALDDLERALLAAGVVLEPGEEAEERQSEEVSAADAFAQGVALVFRELRAGLSRAGLSEQDPTGQRFDPNHHEAVATRPEDGAEAGTIVETVQRGYMISDHSIRPARVIVAE